MTATEVPEGMVALKACPNPWCQARDTSDPELLAAHQPIAMESRAVPGRWIVACPVCPIDGPSGSSAAEAIDRWNTRTPDPEHTRLRELNARLVEGLRFYADESAWNAPPVQTVNHEIFGRAYQNQASKVRLDRGKHARILLAEVDQAHG